MMSDFPNNVVTRKDIIENRLHRLYPESYLIHFLGNGIEYWSLSPKEFIAGTDNLMQFLGESAKFTLNALKKEYPTQYKAGKLDNILPVVENVSVLEAEVWMKVASPYVYRMSCDGTKGTYFVSCCDFLGQYRSPCSVDTETIAKYIQSAINKSPRYWGIDMFCDSVKVEEEDNKVRLNLCVYEGSGKTQTKQYITFNIPIGMFSVDSNGNV